MATAYTEAPTNANGLMRQRFRWSFGILQAVYKHRGVMARKGVLGWVALPNIVIFQILLPLVSPLIDIMFAVGTLWYYIQKHYHPDSTDPADFHKLVLFFFAFLVIDFIASAIAFALERRRSDDKEDAWLLSQVWLRGLPIASYFRSCSSRRSSGRWKGESSAWDKARAHGGRRTTCRQRAASTWTSGNLSKYYSSAVTGTTMTQILRFRRHTIQVCIRGFDVCVLHAFGLKPFPEVSVHRDQAILCAASNPEQMELLIRFGVKAGKIFFKIVGNAAGTEGADPGELIEIVESGQQRF
jgi:hypothetical protein